MIEHLPGIDNVVSDALSLVETPTHPEKDMLLPTEIRITELVEAEEAEPELRQYYTS